jgi:glutamyl-tRNA synthetase
VTADGRFAPSPTGVLHLGNLRTALLAWLSARSAGARFLVRIEDLDAGRVRPGLAEAQLADLAALGLDWDGEVVAQSARGALYEAALGRLDTYECFCTRAEIRESASAAHGPPDHYPGTCRSLSDAEGAARRAAGRVPALRVRADGAVVEFEDRLLGRYSGPVDDFVVRRNDGAFAYNLAVVVDDADQGIGEVVRGADLVDSTPRQLWLYRALGLAEPVHAHVPLVLGPDGRRLAKRHGAVTLREVAAADALAWMAWSVGLRGSTPRELLAGFDPAALPREPTVFAGG